MDFRTPSVSESVKFALRELEVVRSVEAADLSGATKLSGVSTDLEWTHNMLEKILRVLMKAQANSEEIDPNAKKCMQELEVVAKFTGTATLMFINKVQSANPAPLPEIFRKIKPKPVDFLALHEFKISIQKIKLQIESLNVEHLQEPNDRAITQPARQPIDNIDDIWLLGLYIYQKCILQIVVDQSLQTRYVVQAVGTNYFAKAIIAEKIYQSAVAKTHFEACFWFFPQILLDTEYVNLGYKSHRYMFQPIDILRKMLVKLGLTNSSDARDADYLVMSRLREYLMEKRCLVVIDNNWTELWTLLNAAFPDGNNGSRILITSERPVFSDYIYELPFLNYQDSLNFLKELGKRNSQQFQENPFDLFLDSQFLCDPSFCQNDRTRPNRVDENKWYGALPSVLKMCIAYMAAVFPCGSTVHADSLIRLWICEGIIPHQQGKSMKDAAQSYLDQHVQTAQSYLDLLVQRGLLRIVEVYYHNQANHPIRSIVLHPSLHRTFNLAALKKTSSYGTLDDEKKYAPVTVIHSLDAMDLYNDFPEETASWHRLAVHLPYQFNHSSSFAKGPTLQCFKCPNLHSLFFFGSVVPVESSQFNFLRVLAVFASHIQFPEEHTPCWLDELTNLRYLGFIVCLVEGRSLGKTLNSLGKLEILDLSESIFLGISEFIKNNKKVTVVGPVKDELRESWFPVPDMSQ